MVQTWPFERPNRLAHLPRRSGAASWAVLMGSAVLGSGACAGVLGIEEAECDVSYSAACSGVPSESISEGGSDGPGASGASTMSSAGAAGSGAAGSGAAGSGAAGSGAAGSGAAAGSLGVVTNGGQAGTALMPSTGGEDALCNRYCDQVAESCVEDNEQYASREACLAVCALLEGGDEGDASGNTVQCRLGRATLATTTGEPGDYCFSAGPGGAGVCGSDCEGYCAIMTGTCDDFDSVAGCLSACADVPDLSEAPGGQRFSTSFQSGDSLQCRLFHVSAATLDPAGHCVHAAGIAVCSATP